MNKIAAALAILRDDELLEEMSKEGVLRGVGNALIAVDKAGQAAAMHMSSKGHEGLAKAVRFAPHVGLAAGGKGVYESEPSKKLRRKYREAKLRRAMRTVQRGY